MSDPDTTASDDTLPLPERAPSSAGEALTIQRQRGIDPAPAEPATPVPGHGTDRFGPKRQRTLGPYHLLAIIGRGGMGAVWEAIDTRLDRHVALKVMLAGSEATPESVERFRREALHAARLRHPNIVPVHDVGHEDGRHYLVMDLVEGESLDAALRHEGISYRDLAALLAKVARAVQYAHEQGVVHRDLKPQNIMIERRGGRPSTSVALTESGVSARGPTSSAFGEPLVMDFGLAKDTEQDSGLSRSGDVMGTPAYMPPEQAEGRLDEVGPRSDVYSLGAILYEMLTRRPPFVGENAVQVMKALVLEDPVWPRRLAPSVPRDLETICLKCLEKRPDRRYVSAAALATDLDAWLAGDPIAARPIGGIERLLKRVRKDPAAYAVGAAAAVIIAVGSAGFMLSLDHKATEAVKALEDFRSAQQARQRAESANHLLEERQRAESLRSWQLVFSDDFSDTRVADRWRLIGADCAVADGELRFLSERPSFAVLKQPVVGDVAIEYDCRIWGERLDDVSCFLRAIPPDPAVDIPIFDADTGYAFKYGCYQNTQNRLMRDGKTLLQEQASPLKTQGTYHVRAEQIGERLVLTVDGRQVFEARDPHPIEDGARTALGLSCYWSKAAFDNVRVFIYGASLKEDLLDAAQRHLQSGHLVTARDLFMDVRDSSTDASRRQLAAAGAEHARIAIERLDHFSLVSQRVAELHPKAKNAVQMAEDGVQVDLSATKGLDLAALAGLPIASLRLTQSDVTDLSPLRAMLLKHLWIDHTQVRDLSPLAGLPLISLECSALPCGADGSGHNLLEPLRGMRLESLTCNNDGLDNLSALAGMPLTQLQCVDNAIASLEPLAGAPLTELTVGRNRITSLAPLRGMQLTLLRCPDNPIADLGPLVGMPLHALMCDGTDVSSIEILRGMPLDQLSFGSTGVTSLEPLRGMRLSMLDCSWDDVRSLDALTGMHLSSLYCPGAKLTSLEAVRGMPIGFLRCDDNHITSLEPLRGMPINGLVFARNGLTSLEGLQGTKLGMVNICGNAITSLEPLRGLHIDNIRLDRNRITSLEPLADASLRLITCEDNPLASLGAFAEHPPTFLACDMDAIPAEEVARLLAVCDADPELGKTAAPIRWRLATAACARGRSAATSGDFAAAEAAAIQALAWARACNASRLEARIEAERSRWLVMRRAAEKAAAARETLTKAPDDARALGDVGRSLLLSGHEDAAMPMLARGADGALRGLAALELAADRSADSMVGLAKGWCEAAMREDEAAAAIILADRAWRWRDALPIGAGVPRSEDLDDAFARLARLPWYPRLRAEWIPLPEGMSPYPAGFALTYYPALSRSDDPTGPCFGEMVQYNAGPGSELEFDLRCSFAATTLTVTCAAIEGLTIDVRDVDGAVLAHAGPFHEGDHVAVFTLRFLPHAHVRIHMRDRPAFWFMIYDITVH